MDNQKNSKSNNQNATTEMKQIIQDLNQMSKMIPSVNVKIQTNNTKPPQIKNQ